jgi:hypothetical protein
MARDEQCRAVTRGGLRCSNRAKTAGFCGLHLPTARITTSVKEKAKLVTEVAAAAGGIVALIAKIVELWQSLPFGPGPKMPDDYVYLRNALGPIYPSFPDRYTRLPRVPRAWTGLSRVAFTMTPTSCSNLEPPTKLRRRSSPNSNRRRINLSTRCSPNCVRC